MKVSLFKYPVFLILMVGISAWNTLCSQPAPLTGEALFGNITARQIGPAVMSGRISDIMAVNRDPRIIYVGTAGGGLWKSSSAGGAFSPVFDDYTMSIGKIAIDQNHPDTIWVGTGEPWVRNSVSVGTGIYKTINGGSTWEYKGLEFSERISDILIDYNHHDVVYVAVQGHLWNANEDRGVYKTMDGGKTWEKVLYVDANTGCADLEMDPDNPEVLYASMWDHRREPDFFTSGGPGSGLYKSMDGGKTWKKIQNGLPEEILGRMAIAVAPSNGQVIYLSVETKTKEKKGLYKSIDGGENWKMINTDFNTTVRPFYFSRIDVDPKNDSVVYKCGLNLIISKDGGERFRSVGSGVHSDIHCVWIDPGNKNHILIGTDGGVYRSLDGGYLFEMFMNLPVSQFYHVSVDNEEPYNVYGGLQDNGSWWGPSRKAGGITNSDWKLSYGGDGFYSFRHPSDKNIIFSEYQGGKIIRYNIQTGQAKDIQPYPADGEVKKFRFNWNAPIHLSPNHPERMYFGAQFLFVTEDKGESWKQISPDLTSNDPQKQRQSKSGGLSIDNSTAENNTTIYAISEAYNDEKVIWAGTDDGYLQVTENSGLSWTNVSSHIPGIPPDTWISYIESGRFDRNTAFVTIDNHRNGDKKPYLYKTTDLGKTWTSLVTPDIEGYALSIRQDLVNPDLLFLGTEFGLYITIDGGKTWSRFKNNIPKAGIYDMVIHPKEDALVMASHGRGIIIIDDITPLRNLRPEVLSMKFQFLPVKPAIITDPGSGGDWYGGAGNFIGTNPTEVARVIYYADKRHTFGKMYLEFYDRDGKMIREIPAGKSAGINIVEIPIRSEKPKSAPTNNRSALFGSLFGPALPAGEYKVKLIKGKEEYETTVQIQYDPKAPYTLEERELQRQYTVKLYDLSEDLAYIYYALKEMENQAKVLSTTYPKLNKKLVAFSKEVASFSASLVALEGDFYVDEGEQIRERISELYMVVSQYPGRPSDTQIFRTSQLEKEMTQINEKFINLENKNLVEINNLVEKNKGNKISYMSKKEFLSD